MGCPPTVDRCYQPPTGLATVVAKQQQPWTLYFLFFLYFFLPYPPLHPPAFWLRGHLLSFFRVRTARRELHLDPTCSFDFTNPLRSPSLSLSSLSAPSFLLPLLVPSVNRRLSIRSLPGRCANATTTARARQSRQPPRRGRLAADQHEQGALSTVRCSRRRCRLPVPPLGPRSRDTHRSLSSRSCLLPRCRSPAAVSSKPVCLGLHEVPRRRLGLGLEFAPLLDPRSLDTG